MGKASLRQAVPALRAILDLDTNDIARSNAAIILGMSGHSDAPRALRKALLTDGSPKVRAAVASAYIDTLPKDTQAVKDLGKVLRTDPNTNVRTQAADALGRYGDVYGQQKIARNYLIEALSDKDFLVRGMAARELGKIGERKALRALASIAERDPRPEVRKIARAARSSILKKTRIALAKK